MENFIIRLVALLCGAGSAALFWVFGVFVVVPWRQERLLDLTRNEVQAIGVPLVTGIAVAWVTLHLLALGDRQRHPRGYAFMAGLFLIALLAAAIGGISWTAARLG